MGGRHAARGALFAFMHPPYPARGASTARASTTIRTLSRSPEWLGKENIKRRSLRKRSVMPPGRQMYVLKCSPLPLPC